MTYRSLHGVTFKVFSPSHYEAVANDAHISLITVSFHPRQWWVDILMADGTTRYMGPYASLNIAVQMMAYGRVMEQTA